MYRYFDCFQSFAVTNNAAVKSFVYACFWSLLVSLLDRFPKVEFLCQRRNTYVILLGIATLPSMGFVCGTLHSYQNCMRVSILTSLANILCCQTERSVCLVDKKWYLSILLICISLLKRKVEWVFLCLRSACIYFPVTGQFISLTHFSICWPFLPNF